MVRTISNVLQNKKYILYVKTTICPNVYFTCIGLNDASELWLENYLMDDKDFQSDLEDIYQQMKPIYEKLHGYVRYKYRDYWGKDKIGEKDPLPAHIFGNMWAQAWENTLSILQPFEDTSKQTILDEVNSALKDQVRN